MAIQQYQYHRRGVLVLGAIFMVFSILWLVASITEKTVRQDVQQRMQSTLAFQTATLKASMEKYSILAALISRRPDIIQALASGDPLAELPQADELAAFFAGISGAGDVWIVNRQGLILASNQPVQSQYSISDRDYFMQAMQGSLGRSSQIISDGQRFYIIASPVFNQGNIVGAVVVRVDLQFVEQVWVLLTDPVLATDEYNRVLVSSEQNWRLQLFSSDKKVASKVLVKNIIGAHQQRLQLRHDNGLKDYLHFAQSIPLLNWQLHVLADYQPVIRSRNLAVFIVLLVMVVASMAYLLWRNRQLQRLQEQRSQQAFALRLERQVRDRTRALTETNHQLSVEIEERRYAEKSLRETQEELIQAAKLAGIGQMSTALAHEYNQPLAAMRSYADNAVAFLRQSQMDAVADNLHRITLLIDKMAGLTKTLRNFAHKSSAQYGQVSLGHVMDELLILLGPQANKQQVQLQLNPPEKDITVIGEAGRLSQIMTNLVVNAMDAVQSSDEKCVIIDWFINNDRACIRVQDTGPGIPAEIRETMFTPFFTTKQTGEGLGLGLFIVMNLVSDLKGSLSLKDDERYGAVFDITLPLANSQ